MVAQGLRENTARASEMAHQWYADYKDGRGCLQRFSFRSLNAKRLWASCHSAFACKSSMRTLRQFSCAKSGVSTWCLATCRSTSPSIKTRTSVYSLHVQTLRMFRRHDLFYSSAVKSSWSRSPVLHQAYSAKGTSTQKTNRFQVWQRHLSEAHDYLLRVVWDWKAQQWKTMKNCLYKGHTCTTYYILLLRLKLQDSRLQGSHFSFVSFLNLFHPMCSQYPGMTKSDVPCMEQSNQPSELVSWISHTPRMQARRVNYGQKKGPFILSIAFLIPLMSW